jgi:tetratricopeptide (TPR) repeat protein
MDQQCVTNLNAGPSGSVEAAVVLDGLCRQLQGCTWRRDDKRNEYVVYPTTNALSTVPLGSISVTNMTLVALFQDERVERYMKESGLVMVGPRDQNRKWGDIYVDMEFGGGTFADFLNELTTQMGKGVCWDIVHLQPPLRVLIGNRVVDRPSFRLSFTTVPGGKMMHMRDVLREATMDELVGMLKSGTHGKRSAAALELACRYLQKEDKTKAAECFKVAIDSADSKVEQWDMKRRVLELGGGYPSSDHAVSSKIEQYEAFLRDCSDRATRYQALSALLDSYLSARMEVEARALIDAAAKCEKDHEWHADAVRVYQKKRPDAAPLAGTDGQKQHSENEAAVIRTQYTVEKAEDGKLKVHEAVEMKKTCGVMSLQVTNEGARVSTDASRQATQCIRDK